MTGIQKLTNIPIGNVRGFIEVVVLIFGFYLGGKVGVGTLIFAFFIGPIVAISLQLTGRIGRVKKV